MLIGDTVRITGSFLTWAGSKVDAINPKINVYDSNRNLLESLAVTHITTGEYQADYVVADGSLDLIFELVGEVEGKPEVGRIQQQRTFV